MKSKITERERDTATLLKIDAIVSAIVRKLPFNVAKIFRYNIRTIFIVQYFAYVTYELTHACMCTSRARQFATSVLFLISRRVPSDYDVEHLRFSIS